MKVSTAIITAAGRTQRKLPLQTLTDREGQAQTVLRLFLDELRDAGIDKIGVIIRPGDRQVYEEAAGDLSETLTFIEQTEPLGYGHAVHCAKEFTSGEAFLLMVSDHLFVSDDPEQNCAQQVIEVAEAQESVISAVQSTHESKLPYFGAVAGKLFEGQPGLYEIEKVIEKPTPTVAEQELMVPGLKLGHYLCFFGMHVLTPAIMDLLGQGLATASEQNPLQLSPAIAALANRERCLALELKGRRYDLERQFGLLMGQFAVALDGKHRDELLEGIIELLAQARR
ncbi:MAG: sugar phosphate nucleotidyltransferase [Verrucomicrobiota bacterium]